MSYILDALRRADAERARGAVPGLSTWPVDVGTMASSSGASRTSWTWWAGGLVGVVFLGAVATALWPGFRKAPKPDVVVMGMPVPVPVPAPSLSPPLPGSPTAPTAVTSLKESGQTAAMASGAVVDRTVRVPVPASAAPSVLDRKPGSDAQGVLPSSSAVPAKPSLPASSKAEKPMSAQADAGLRGPGGPSKLPVAGEPPALPMDQLPQDVRRQLPALTLNGVTYSSNALYRMAIINGQVLHERDEAAPGVVLERIDQRSAVMRYRNYRYVLSY